MKAAPSIASRAFRVETPDGWLPPRLAPNRPAPDGRLSFIEVEYLLACFLFLVASLGIGHLLRALAMAP